MTTAYTILATITLQHEYYADGRCYDFDVVPSPATAAALNGVGVLSKTVGNVLLLLAKTDEHGAPFIALPVGLKLCFYLRLNNPSFLNYTNVAYGGAGEIFYFTNLYATGVNGLLYLNRRLPDFHAGSSYAIGDLVRDGGDVYEAIKVKPAIPGGYATSNAAFWYKRSSEQYVHSGDRMRLTDGRLQVATAPAREFDIAVFGLNPESLLYDLPVGDAMHQAYTQDQESITVNLSNRAPGKYSVVVNGVEELVYVDAAASQRPVFGIIELHHVFGSAHDFGLLNAGGAPKGLDHIIRFSNRLAIWKYITRTTEPSGIRVGLDDGLFIGAAPQFRSVAPMPLRQDPLKTLSLLKGSTVLSNRLANPAPERIARFKDADENDYYCAEVYLNF